MADTLHIDIDLSVLWITPTDTTYRDILILVRIINNAIWQTLDI